MFVLNFVRGMYGSYYFYVVLQDVRHAGRGVSRMLI
jgi:hypothetical protein